MKETKEKRIAKRGMAWSMSGLVVVLLLVWLGLDTGLINSEPDQTEWKYLKIGEVSIVGYPVKAIIYVDSTRLWEVKEMVELNEVDLEIDYYFGALAYAKQGVFRGSKFFVQFMNESDARVWRQ